ncbi:hypothetical protein Fmac_000235 [Flemingia macrophylla]|uniref:Uncharacterized protein n=1 Tax=Flemingia macrophylla TaxID=520843 RepID=A0ABD1NGI8_9FABA
MEQFETIYTHARSEVHLVLEARITFMGPVDEEIIRNKCWIALLGGITNRGRLYGVGKVGSTLRLGDTFPNLSSGRSTQESEKILQLEQEVRQSREETRQSREEARQSREQNERLQHRLLIHLFRRRSSPVSITYRMDSVRGTEQKQAFGPNKNRRMKKNGASNRRENLDTCAGLLSPPSSVLLVQQQPPLLPLPHVWRNPSIQGHVNNKMRSRYFSLKKGSGTQSIINRDDFPEEVPAEDDVVWGSVFSLAPPPSSLPLPRFSLRSKLACNAAAAASGGVDDGATDNLRRLLRLR